MFDEYRRSLGTHAARVLDSPVYPALGAALATGRSSSSRDVRDIVFIQGDVRAPDLGERIARALPDGARCLVSEDSAHLYDTTYGALESLSPFVPPEGFFVVEDGVIDIDELRVDASWPRGVLPAVRD